MIPGTITHDLVVTIDSDDDWTVCDMTAILTSGTFVNDDTYNPPVMPTGDTVYDSFLTSPALFPNTTDVGFILYPDIAPVEEPQFRWGEWYDTVDTGGGVFVLSRLTFRDSGTLIVDGHYAVGSTGGQLYPYHFEVMYCDDPNDIDCDGILNWDDNCLSHWNPDQADCDGDGLWRHLHDCRM